MTLLFMDYSATNSVQCTSKILTFTKLTVNLNAIIVITITKHLLKGYSTEGFPVDVQD